MYIDRSVSPGDIPAPPTPNEVVAAFPVPVFGFVPQETLEETSAGTMTQSANGVTVMQQVSLSYTFWRHPSDHSDPANLAELTDFERRSLDVEPIAELPQWMLDARERMLYPTLGEAVNTTYITDPDVARLHTPEYLLVQHLNHIVTNQFRDERMTGGFPGELLGAATESCVEHGIPVEVDGVFVPGMRVDTDAHVFGVAAALGGSVLTAVASREWLPFVRLAFVSRPWFPPTWRPQPVELGTR